MTTTSHATHSFGLDVRATPSGRLVRASGRLLVGAGADDPGWARLAAGDALEHVTLDLEAVTAIDAAGVGRLLRIRQRLGARGARLTIEGAAHRVGRVLALTGVDTVMGIAPRQAADGHDRSGAPAVLCRCA